MKEKVLQAMRVFLLALAFTLFAACDKTEQETTEQYQYLNAAEEREDVTEAERAEYASYAWRRERKNEAGLPKNFRTCRSEFVECDPHNGYDPDYVPSREGMDQLMISASSDFSDMQLDSVVAEIRKIHSGPITIVDLRKEFHGLLNGNHVSRYGKHNWENIGLSRDTIVANEQNLFHSSVGQQIVTYTLNSSNSYQLADPDTLLISSAKTEEEQCAERGLGYYRLTVLDHCFTDPRSLDNFIAFTRNLPADTWLHFHCQAGKGRTTMYMVFYDFLRNPDVSEKDVVYRQYKIGGNFMYYKGDDPDEDPFKVELSKERAEMVPLVYRYIQENHAQGFPVSWSQWKQQF